MVYYIMFKKSLKETNPHLKDPQKRHDLFVTFVSSSTAIETKLTRKMLKEIARSSKGRSKPVFIHAPEESDQLPP
jgi:hypothetical protein